MIINNLAEVDRAVDNLIKSGKFYQNSGSRRGEHIPQMSSMGPTGRSYNEMGMFIHPILLRDLD